MIITIHGKPLGKQRARTLKSGRSYTPEQTVNYETLVKLCYTEQKGDNFGEQQLKMGIIAYYPIPKSTSKKKEHLMLLGEIRPTKKPDLDNVVKLIADGLNGIAYYDDSQIVELVATKYYSLIPRVDLHLRVSCLNYNK